MRFTKKIMALSMKQFLAGSEDLVNLPTEVKTALVNKYSTLSELLFAECAALLYEPKAGEDNSKAVHQALAQENNAIAGRLTQQIEAYKCVANAGANA